MSKIRVGDKLWCAVDARGFGREPDRFEVVVTKVGRLWLTLARTDGNTWWEDRVSVSTLRGDRIQCHKSRDIYEAELTRNTQWERVRIAVVHTYYRPDWATDAWLDATIALFSTKETGNASR